MQQYKKLIAQTLMGMNAFSNAFLTEIHTVKMSYYVNWWLKSEFLNQWATEEFLRGHSVISLELSRFFTLNVLIENVGSSSATNFILHSIASINVKMQSLHLVLGRTPGRFLVGRQQNLRRQSFPGCSGQTWPNNQS